MARYKNIDWTLPNEGIGTWERVQVAILMDIRDELQSLNSLLHCPNFVAMPRLLRDVKRNTTKQKRRKKNA